jgi:hypothetical protein
MQKKLSLIRIKRILSLFSTFSLGTFSFAIHYSYNIGNSPVYAETYVSGKSCMNNQNCGAQKIVTSEKYYGIQATLNLPQNLKVPKDHSYVAFYLGFDNTCEGGISYKNEKWNRFLNCGKDNSGKLINWSQPIGERIPSQIHVKLVNNGDGSASLYIGHSLAITLNPGLPNATTVKAVHSTYNGKNTREQDRNSYTDASFTNIQIKTTPGISGIYRVLPARRIISEYNGEKIYSKTRTERGLTTHIPPTRP